MKKYIRLIILILILSILNTGISYAADDLDIIKVAGEDITVGIADVPDNYSFSVEGELYFPLRSHYENDFYIYCFLIEEKDGLPAAKSSALEAKVIDSGKKIIVSENENLNAGINYRYVKSNEGDIISFYYNNVLYGIEPDTALYLVSRNGVGETVSEEQQENLVINIAIRNDNEKTVTVKSIDARLIHKEIAETFIEENVEEITDISDTEQIKALSDKNLFSVFTIVILSILLALTIVILIFLLINNKKIKDNKSLLEEVDENNKMIIGKNSANEKLLYRLLEETEKLNEVIINKFSGNNNFLNSLLEKLNIIHEKTIENETNETEPPRILVSKDMNVGIKDNGEFMDGEIVEGDIDTSIFLLNYQYYEDSPEEILEYNITIKEDCEVIFGGKIGTKKIGTLFLINNDYDRLSEYSMEIYEQPILAFESNGVKISKKGVLNLKKK